jgi:small subunit ribosomal protein S17
MDKTIVVAVETLSRHPLYGKTVKHVTKLKAHDEDNKAKIGDLVEIAETRPLSRTKRWRLFKILEKVAEVPEIGEEIEEREFDPTGVKDQSSR